MEVMSAAASPSVSLDTRYRLLASAIAGRAVRIADTDHELAFSDQQRIFLPGSLTAEEMTIAVIVQAQLIANGSLNREVATRLIGKRAATRRYVLFEAARAARVNPRLLPPAASTAIASLELCPRTRSPLDSADQALRQSSIQAPPPCFGTMHPLALLRAGSPETASLSQRDMKRLGQDGGPEEEEEDPDDPDGAGQQDDRKAKSGGPFQSPLGKIAQHLFGADRRSAEDGSGEMGTPRGARFVNKTSGFGKLISFAPALRRGERPGPPADATYPEWDCDRNRYQPAWCRVYEYDPAAHESQGDLALDADSGIVRSLARITLGHRWEAGERAGDRLNLTALLEYGVMLASGNDPDDRIFEARRRTDRDLGVFVLLDASGSTAERSSEGLQLWDDHRQAAYRLTAALNKLGDRVALSCFRSHGRGDVQFLRVKDFNDQLDRSARDRLRSIRPTGFTRLGAAIRHGSHVLTTQASTAHRLLIVVSDGFPYDDEYEGRYAYEDCRHALAESTRGGVGCVCLTVGSATDDEMFDRVWGNVSHLRLKDIDELKTHIRPALTTALKAARSAGSRNNSLVSTGPRRGRI